VAVVELVGLGQNHSLEEQQPLMEQPEQPEQLAMLEAPTLQNIHRRQND